MSNFLADPFFIFFRSTEIIYGLFWLFSSLNAHFQWKKIPFVSNEMDEFITACHKTKFIMPTVKIVELIVGVLLLFSFTNLALVLILPIVYGIIGLHLFFNKKKWRLDIYNLDAIYDIILFQTQRVIKYFLLCLIISSLIVGNSLTNFSHINFTSFL